MAEESNQETFLNPSRRSYVYETSRGGSGSKKRVILIIIGVIILVALVAYAVIATGGKGEIEPNLTPAPTEPLVETPTPATETPTPTEADETPTPTAKASPTPGKGTPTPTGTSGLERSSLKVAVLNGSGVAGAATKMSDALKDLGYDVVSSGNADNFEYEETEIQVKSTKKSYLSQLESDLEDDYTIGSATSDYAGTAADAVVIVGKE